MIRRMTRITVDVNDEWLAAAREVLGTDTKVATINAALQAFALRRQAVDVVRALDGVQVEFDGSEHGWRFGGGRDLDGLIEKARQARST
jgi:Arc/MetJ family transcription regulator